MRFIHTADWHIGRMLYGKKRYAEFEQFLDWLAEKIRTLEADVLLVPGDIFDTRAPSNYAQQLYYEFLVKVSKSCCRHVVITSGNHDSPSFLDASKSLLKALNVHVIGVPDEPEKELIELKDADGKIEALVAAVPYLRDRDVRTVELGESMDDKDQKIIAGIKHHYQQLADLAEIKIETLNRRVPVLAMGHLFASEGKVGDGVRDLYIGNLGSISSDTFSPTFDYVALGHLHVSQTVGGKDHIRYSGSPIPMGYGEAGQEKEIIVVDFDHDQMQISSETVPTFQDLVRINGDLDELLEKIAELNATESKAWLEVDYTGKEVRSDLRDLILDATGTDTNLEILRIKSQAAYHSLSNSGSETRDTLEDLTEQQVFDRCLDAYEVPDDEREAITATYQEALADYREMDQLAK